MNIDTMKRSMIGQTDQFSLQRRRCGVHGIGARDAMIVRLTLLSLCAAVCIWVTPDAVIAQPLTSSEAILAPAATGLNTDSETESLLQRAEDFVKEGNRRDAVVIYQHIFDNAGDSMTTLDAKQGIYKPVRLLIEKRLAMPEARQLLDEYRLNADAVAKGLLMSAKGPRRDEKLQEVVRRYFVSSYGDEAAYQLACILLDKEHFMRARRLLLKILEQHPDSDISRKQIRIRLAIASARAGEVERANTLLKGMTDDPNVNLAADLIRNLQREIKRATNFVQQNTPANNRWAMRLGNPSRTGHMKGFPKQWFADQDFWTQTWAVRARLQSGVRSNASYRYQRSGGTTPLTRSALVNLWRAGRLPVGDILMDKGRVYMKVLPARPDVPPELLCLDALTGKLVMTSAKDHTANVQGFSFYIPQVTPEEVMHFRDRLSRSLTMVDETIYTVEGGRYGMGVGILTPYNGTEAYNTLVAYKIEGRKFVPKWRAPVSGGARHRHPDDQPDIQINKVNYLSLPVPAGPGSPGLIVIVRRQNGLYAQSLSRKTGAALWETYLCQEPAQSLRWSPVGVAVDGGEVYIGSGVGFVFALDATDGQIHWSATYKQSKQTQAGRQWGGRIATQNQRNGWDQDTVIARGGYVIVAPSDSPDLLRFDRRTGRHDRNTRDESDWKYIMGVLGDNLYVGGQSQIWRFSIRTFKRQSMASSLQGIEQSLGRGVVTESALYIPTKDGIVLLDPYSDRILKKIGLIRVDSARSSDPIGNLFSDGRNLIVTGLDRTYALVGAAARLKQLDWRVERGDVKAMMERGRIRREAGKLEGALSDFRKAFEISTDSIDRRRARDLLLNVLLAHASLTPSKAGPWLEEAQRLVESHDQRLRIQLALADHSTRQGKIDRAMRLYLSVATDPVGGTLAVADRRAQTTVVGSQAAASALRKLLGEHPSLAAKLHEEAEKIWSQAQKDAGPQGMREKTQLEIDVRNALVQLSKARQLDNPDVAKIQKLEDFVSTSEQRIELLRRRRRDPLATVLMLERAFPETLAVVKAAQIMAKQAAIDFKARAPSQYETAEWMLMKLSEAGQKRTAATALAALARFHQSVGQIQQAAMEWQRLKRDYSGVNLATDPPILAQIEAQQGLDTIPQDLRSNPLASLRQMPKLPLQFLWKSETTKFGRVGLGPHNYTQFIEEHLLVINKATNRLHCKDVRTGRDDWVVQLFRADTRMSLIDKRYSHYYGYSFPNGHLLRAGHIGVLWNPGKTTRIEVIGLVTGRSLWRFGRTNEIPSKGTMNPMGFAHLAVGNGLIAVVLDDPTQGPRVRAYDLFTGKHRWTRSFARDAVGGIHIAHGYVHVLLNGGRQIVVCDRRTGSQLGQIRLTIQSSKRPALWPTRGLVHERDQSLVMSKLPSGQDQWTLALPPSKSDSPKSAELHSLNDRYIYVVTRRSAKSHHWIVDTQTGKRVVDLSPTNNTSVQIQVAMSQDGKNVLAFGPSDSGGMQLTRYALATGKAAKPILFDKSAIGLTLENLWADSAVVPIAKKSSNISEVNFFDIDSATMRKDFVLSSANRRGTDSPLFGNQSDGRFYGLSFVEVRGDVLLITSKTHGMAAFGHRRSPRRDR